MQKTLTKVILITCIICLNTFSSLFASNILLDTESYNPNIDSEFSLNSDLIQIEVEELQETNILSTSQADKFIQIRDRLLQKQNKIALSDILKIFKISIKQKKELKKYFNKQEINGSFFSETKSKLEKCKGSSDSTYLGSSYQQFHYLKFSKNRLNLNLFIRKKEHELYKHGQGYYSLSYKLNNIKLFLGLHRLKGYSGFFLNKNSTYLKIRDFKQYSLFQKATSPYYALNSNGGGFKFNLTNIDVNIYYGQNYWTINKNDKNEITKINYNELKRTRDEIYSISSKFKYLGTMTSLNLLDAKLKINLAYQTIENSKFNFEKFGQRINLIETGLTYKTNLNNQDLTTTIFLLHNWLKANYVAKIIWKNKKNNLHIDFNYYNQNCTQLDPFNQKLSYNSHKLFSYSLGLEKTLSPNKNKTYCQLIHDIYKYTNSNIYYSKNCIVTNSKLKLKTIFIEKTYNISLSVYFKQKEDIEANILEKTTQPKISFAIKGQKHKTSITSALIIDNCKNEKIQGHILYLGNQFKYKNVKLTTHITLFDSSIPFYIYKAGIGRYNENLILSGKGSYIDTKLQFKYKNITSWLGYAKINYYDKEISYSGNDEVSSPITNKIAFGIQYNY